MKNIMKIFLLHTVILLYEMNIAHAQTWTNYTTTTAGIVNNNIHAIAIDAYGNKWFGTHGGGISKFDGINWTTYNTANGLADNYVHDIAIDVQGNIWIGTYSGGVSMFDGYNWTTYTTADGLGDNDVYSIAIDTQNNIWVGTFYGGASKFDGLNWTTYTTANGLADNYVCDIAIDFQGNIWFGTNGGGVSKFDGVNWTTYTTTDGLGYNYISAIGVDGSDNIWFGPNALSMGPISKYNGSNWSYYTIPYVDANANTCAILMDMNGNKWIGAAQGAYKFDDTTWTQLIVSFMVTAIAIDEQGNKWFGTDGLGVWELSDGGAGPLNSACILSGSIFYDANQNGILDSGETKLQGNMVELLDDSTFSSTQSNGNFYLCRDTGTYYIRCISNNYWQYTTDSIITVNVSDTSELIDNLNFGIHLLEPVNDVSVDITGSATRANFNAKYWLTYRNEASVTESGTVVLNIDPLTTFVSSVPSPDIQNGNTITWNYSNLVPFEQRQIQLFLHMPDVNHLGEAITTTAVINPLPGDVAPTNNYDTLDQVISGSYDPNDKSVDKGVLEEGYTHMGEELTYTIHFQNTGTDTAFTVQVRDTIDSDMDVASLKIISSSHNVRLDVKGQNIVTFIFDNILLPDSGTNEAASSGFVKFSIDPKPGLPEYTVVRNKAYIYFDFNPAVVTNQVVNTYVGSPEFIDEGLDNDHWDLLLFPNPASGYLNIISDRNYKIEILNMQGLLIKNISTTNKLMTIDISDLPAGIFIIKAENEDDVVVRQFIKMK